MTSDFPDDRVVLGVEQYWSLHVLILFRIVLTLVLAALATLAVLAAIPIALGIGSAGEDARLWGSLLMGLGLFAPLLFALGCVWLPVLLFCRNRGYEARQWAILLAPVAWFVGEPIYRLATGAAPGEISAVTILARFVFATPVMMMLAAFFLYFDRLWTTALAGRTGGQR